MAREETDSKRETPGVSTRQLRLLMAVGIIVGAIVGPAVVIGAQSMLALDTDAKDVTLQAPTGPAVTFALDTQTNLSAPFPAPDTIRWNSTAGNMTISSPSLSNGTVVSITDEWTKLKALNVSAANLTVDQVGKTPIAVGGDVEMLRWRPPVADDNNVDLVYQGPSGTTTIVLNGLTANETVHAVDVDANVRLGSADVDATGRAAFTGLPNSKHRVLLTYDNLSDVAPYYENVTANGNSSSWLPSPPNASLDTIGDLLARIGPAVIGTGGVDGSGTGIVGALLTGLLMVAAALGALLGTGAGPVGGIIAALVTGWTLTIVGVAPVWIRTLLLFGVGMLVSVAALRIWNA